MGKLNLDTKSKHKLPKIVHKYLDIGIEVEPDSIDDIIVSIKEKEKRTEKL
jgi:hypothetical protein